MQIDFHHAVTYICARYAGFSHYEADIIAYSSQYVDDATNFGTINFSNGAKYTRINSSDDKYRVGNYTNLHNTHLLIPFHFLPGNAGLKAGEEPKEGFYEKLKCTPNSYVAKDMINACFEDRDSSYALHRLGIALHTYADSFSHRDFSGTPHLLNSIKNIDTKNEKDKNDKSNIFYKLSDTLRGLKSKALRRFPIGHEYAKDYPYRPYLIWSYKKQSDEDSVIRNNILNMYDAAVETYNILYAYKNKINIYSDRFDHIRIDAKKFDALLYNFKNYTCQSADKRHNRWLKEINNERFFPMDGDVLEYKPKGKDSWKYLALGTDMEKEGGDELFFYTPHFLDSNWKLFHDALQIHKFDITNKILPNYGICLS